MNDTEGLCSLPLETDDEYITAQGSFPQPPYRTSFMVGFVAVSKIFKIMSEVLFRHRSTQRRLTLLNPKSTPYGRAISPTADQGRVWLDSICEQTPQIGDDGVNDSGGFAELIRRESDWIVNAHDRIREVLDGLPPDLATQRFNGTGETLEESNHLTIGTTAPVGGARSGPGEEPSDLKAIFGMQVANCLITAASVQFALVSVEYLVKHLRGSFQRHVAHFCKRTVRLQGVVGCWCRYSHRVSGTDGERNVQALVEYSLGSSCCKWRKHGTSVSLNVAALLYTTG